LPTIQQTIGAKFLAKLAENKEVDARQIEQLRALLIDDNKKLRPDDFIKIFTIPAGGDLK
jgi:hypothetical protein